jgi:hypothetical protein
VEGKSGGGSKEGCGLDRESDGEGVIAAQAVTELRYDRRQQRRRNQLHDRNQTGSGRPTQLVGPDQDRYPGRQLGRTEDQEGTQDAPQSGRPRQRLERLNGASVGYPKNLANTTLRGCYQDGTNR